MSLLLPQTAANAEPFAQLQVPVVSQPCNAFNAGQVVMQTVTAPDDGLGVVYSPPNIDSGNFVTILATIEAGYDLAEPLPDGWLNVWNGITFQLVWTYTLQSVTCPAAPVAVLTDPVIEAPICGTWNSGAEVWETPIRPADGDGIRYSETSIDGSHMVTMIATLETGYLPPTPVPPGWSGGWDGYSGYVYMWTYQLTSVVCPQVPIAPLFEPVVNPATCNAASNAGTAWESVARPTDGNGWVYSEPEVDSNNVVSINAQLQPGFAPPSILPSGWWQAWNGVSYRFGWTYTLKSTACAGTTDGESLPNTGSESIALGSLAAALLLAGAATAGLGLLRKKALS